MKDRGPDYTIPAPAFRLCPRCNRQVKPGSKVIVRYMGRIFHRACFPFWFRTRQYSSVMWPAAAAKELEAFRVADTIRATPIPRARTPVQAH